MAGDFSEILSGARDIARGELVDRRLSDRFTHRLVEQRTHVAQARELAGEIIQAAEEAERASRAAERLPEPLQVDIAILSPECGPEGKHAACIGTAWDMDKDRLTNCTCDCHEGSAA